MLNLTNLIFTAARKRDDFYKARSNEDNHGLNYLAQAIGILLQWKTSGNSGLTKKTFTACLQSMKAMPSLAKHLLYKHGFEYVLPGKFMPDPIEGRFGWYCQENGAHFFISTKQLLQGEKKIRCLSLLQQQALLSVFQLTTENFSKVCGKNEEVSWLIE